MDSSSLPRSSASCLLAITVVSCGVCRGGGSISSVFVDDVDLPVVSNSFSKVLKRITIIL